MNRNKGSILVEAVLALALITIVVLPVFSQMSFFLKFHRGTTQEESFETFYDGKLTGVGISQEIDVEIVRDNHMRSFILLTDRVEGVCR